MVYTVLAENTGAPLLWSYAKHESNNKDTTDTFSILVLDVVCWFIDVSMKLSRNRLCQMLEVVWVKVIPNIQDGDFELWNTGCIPPTQFLFSYCP